jgi:hypothetical protein
MHISRIFHVVCSSPVMYFNRRYIVSHVLFISFRFFALLDWTIVSQDTTVFIRNEYLQVIVNRQHMSQWKSQWSASGQRNPIHILRATRLTMHKADLPTNSQTLERPSHPMIYVLSYSYRLL